MQSNNNPTKESKDLSLSELPGRKIYDRKLRKSSWVTTLPLILRDLAPTSGFNPQHVWKELQKKEKNEGVGKEGDGGSSEDEGVQQEGGDHAEQGQDKELQEKEKNEKVGEEEYEEGGEQRQCKENVQEQATSSKSDQGGGHGGVAWKQKKKKGGKSKLELMKEKNTKEQEQKKLKFEAERVASLNKYDGKHKLYVSSKIKSSGGKVQTLLQALSDAVKARDKLDAFDVLWALEEIDSSVSGSDVDIVRGWRKSVDIVHCQLNDMSDRLPPLSKYNSKFRLDPWQIDVLRMIDQGKSVVISAPTSSGKTVISTYVASLSKHLDKKHGERCRVLFVVPTEPLVWQVAAHFHKHINDGSVALVTNQLTYSPHQNSSTPPGVTVGTPAALESALTKIRGKYASSESFQNLDRSKLVGGFDHYDWVVYDEIHALDGEEGGALQRLIRLMNCNFLALSATIGNANELRQWMETVRGEQINAEAVTVVEPETEEENTSSPLQNNDMEQLVTLKVHQSRFINLQRHVWHNDSALHNLHPLAAVTLEFLRQDGFKQAALPMTPADSIEMFEAMKEFYPKEAIANLHPHAYFHECMSGVTRITLEKSKEYEDSLKNKLTLLAHSHPAETNALLAEYTLTDSYSQFDICDLVLSLKEKQMTPCLLFHLNVFELITLFKRLVGDLESRQDTDFPDHYTKLARRCAVPKKAKEKKAKGKKPNLKEEERDKQDGVLGNDDEIPDETQPHKAYCFLPNGPIGVKEFDDICDDVQKRDKFEGSVHDHALMRALKRGIGLYINDHHFTAYRVAVMKLAMQGKLGVVLSDSSLAYGVNMPFRTCVFCGEMGGQLSTLIAQQMAGRSGRRGMDTQGHLVYAGATASFTRDLMLAKIPAIRGSEPRYHSAFLQEMLSPYTNPVKYFPHQMELLGRTTLEECIDGATTLPDFRHESINILTRLNLIEECEVLTGEDVTDHKDDDIVRCTGTETKSGFKPRRVADENRASCAKLWMVWEMRSHLAESIILGCMLPDLYREFFVGQADRSGVDDAVQIKFCLFLIITCERQPYTADHVYQGHHATPLLQHPFVLSHLLVDKIGAWEGEIIRIQDSITTSDVLAPEWMMLPPDITVGEPLDGTLFDCIANTKHAFSLNHQTKQFVKESLTSLSLKLIHMHNTLMRDKDPETRDPISQKLTPGRYAQFESITRNCFYRLQDISKSLIQNVVDLPLKVSSGKAV